MARIFGRLLALLVVVAMVGALSWQLWQRWHETKPQVGGGRRAAGPAPVEVVPIVHGPIVLRRQLSGTLEAHTRVTIAPKVAGRIERLSVDLADLVQRGQVVAELDHDEFRQAVVQAEAELAVTQANLAQAQAAQEIADREFERSKTLHERGVASAAQFDTAQAQQLNSKAAVAVAQAQVARATAALEAARIRLGYTTITAAWSEGDPQRLVAERLVEEGDTVSANTPLLVIVGLDPMRAVVFVTERDYGRLEVGQRASISTDAFPRETFAGTVARVAPVFTESSRQARVELEIPNAQGRLKPGMFVRAQVILAAADDAVIVPQEALVQRDGKDVVFVVNPDGEKPTVRMTPVQTGLTDEGKVQLVNANLTGQVVVLGQQLLQDGTEVKLVDPLSNAGMTNGKPAGKSGGKSGGKDKAKPTGNNPSSSTSPGTTSGGNSGGTSGGTAGGGGQR